MTTHRETAEKTLARFKGSQAPQTRIMCGIIESNLAVLDAIEALQESLMNLGKPAKKVPAKKRPAKSPAKKPAS